jgi:hypothetical protein
MMEHLYFYFRITLWPLLTITNVFGGTIPN